MQEIWGEAVQKDLMTKDGCEVSLSILDGRVNGNAIRVAKGRTSSKGIQRA